MLALLTSILIYNLLFVVTTLICLRLVGARAKSVQIGWGPKVQFTVCGLAIALALVPVASWVQIAGRGTEDDEDPGTWSKLSRTRRVLGTLGPWLVLLGVGCSLAGSTRGFWSFARAFEQLLLTWDTTSLVRRFAQTLDTEPYAVGLGLVLCKITAFNLVPLPNLGGWALLTELFGRTGQKPSSSGFLTAVTVLGMVIALSISARFGWGILRAATS